MMLQAADQPKWEKNPRITIRMLKELCQLATNLARLALSGSKQYTEFSREARSIVEQLETIRVTLGYHLEDSEGGLDAGDYEYWIAATYSGEITLLVAKAVLRFESVHHGAPADIDIVEQVELKAASKLVSKAHFHLTRARKKIGKLRWWRRVVLGSGATNKVAHGQTQRRTPLGWGDLEFKIYAAGQAIKHLWFLSRLTPVLRANSDVKLVDNDAEALRKLERHFRAMLRGVTATPTEGTLAIASGLALVKSELLLARFRCSRGTMLERGKINILRAVGYLNQAQTLAEFDRMLGTDTAVEQRRVLDMARRCLKKSAEFAGYSRSFLYWRHDLKWKIFVGADLEFDLRQYGTLPEYSAFDLQTAVVAVNDFIDLADAEIHWQSVP
jgi:hypothetical protein